MYITLIFLITTSSVVANYEKGLERFKSNENLVINQMNKEMEHLESSNIPIRATRIRGNKKRFCGRRLAGFIFATCGECEPGSSENLSMLCCDQQCDLQDIIEACCPNAFK